MAIKLKKHKKEPVKYPIVSYEENEWGRYKVLTQANGVRVKILREPSEKYRDKMAKRAAEEKKRQAELKVKKDKEKLINDKMREMAIKALEKEGKI
jgi:hypothetical protein